MTPQGRPDFVALGLKRSERGILFCTPCGTAPQKRKDLFNSSSGQMSGVFFGAKRIPDLGHGLLGLLLEARSHLVDELCVRLRRDEVRRALQVRVLPLQGLHARLQLLQQQVGSKLVSSLRLNPRRTRARKFVGKFL